MAFKKGHKGFRNDESYALASVKIKNNPNSARTRFQKGSSGFKGKHTEQTRLKIKIARERQGSNVWNKGKKYTKIAGEKHWNWRGGIAKINKTERQIMMETLEYKLWRKAVFERDGYFCIWGGKEHGKKIEADHIKPWAYYPELRFAIDNGRTLCHECHKKTDTYGNRKIK